MRFNIKQNLFIKLRNHLWLPNSYCLRLDQLWRPQRCKINDLVSEIFRHVTGHHSSVRNQNFGRPGHRSQCIRTAQNGTVHPYLYGYGEQPYYKLKPFQSSLKITNSYGLGNNSENKREVQKKKKFKNSKTNKF